MVSLEMLEKTILFTPNFIPKFSSSTTVSSQQQIKNHQETTPTTTTSTSSTTTTVFPSSISATASKYHVGGYEAVKKRLSQLITKPLLFPEAYARLGVEIPSGVLLYGPSGCGKTLLVHHLAATECSRVAFLPVNVSELFSKYLGESEKNIRKLFLKAREIAPCILFFDDVETIALKRSSGESGSAASHSSGVEERLLGQLLTELDGIQDRKGIMVIGCTNKKLSILDEALLRPGRFEHHVPVSLPDFHSRREILKVISETVPFHTDVQIDSIAQATQGYSGARLKSLIRESAMHALRVNLESQYVSHKDILEVLGQESCI